VKQTSRQHLSDERLIGAYFEGAGTVPGPGAAGEDCDHVRSCDECRNRLTDLTASLERLRKQAVAEADAYFTPDRLAAQQDRVLRHLEGQEHPARVIPFPRLPARVRTAGVRHPLYRWVAAAAAAGLLIGVSAGRLLYVHQDQDSRVELNRSSAPSVQARAAQPAPRAQASPRQSLTGSVAGDEALLSEIDSAVRQPQVSGLRELDALTPRVQEASVRVK